MLSQKYLSKIYHTESLNFNFQIFSKKILTFTYISISMVQNNDDYISFVVISEKCVPIANNTSGRICCKPGKHIHIEQVWLDREPCPIRLTTNSTEVTKISIISCQNISNCTVPFQWLGKLYLYVNIRFRCLGM